METLIVQKKCIVVLGNHEDCYLECSKHHAPVLRYSILRLLITKAVSEKRTIQQGDCKKAFCNAALPEDKVTAIWPPIGNPTFHNDEYWLLKKTSYGLCRYPHHWYNTITKILHNMGLQASPYDSWPGSPINQTSSGYLNRSLWRWLRLLLSQQHQRTNIPIYVSRQDHSWFHG